MAQEVLDALAAFETKQEQGESNSKFWKLPSKFEGTKITRVLPPIKSKEEKLFFHPYKYHYIGGQFVRCAGRGKCKVCKKATQLWDGDNPHSESSETAKKMFAKDGYLSRIVVRDEKEGNTTAVFGYGAQVFKKLCAIMKDADYGDITDVKKGNDFKLKKEGTGRNSKYENSSASPNKTPIADSADEIKKLLKEAMNLEYEECLDQYDPEVASSAIEDFLSEDHGEEAEDSAPVNQAPKSQKTAGKAEKEADDTDEDIQDDELDDLLDEFEKEA